MLNYAIFLLPSQHFTEGQRSATWREKEAKKNWGHARLNSNKT